MKWKAHFERIKKWVMEHKIKTGVLVLVLALVVGAVVSGYNGTELKTHTVARSSFEQNIAVSGKVEAPQDVSMSFETSGRVARIYSAVGESVRAGQPLVSLSLGTLSADLLRAQAELAAKSIANDNSSVNVDNALRTLLSDGLVATPSSDTYVVTPPIITGAYNSAMQGTYKIIIKRVTGGSDKFELRVFDLEKPEAVKISEVSATALGTRGLYVSFPDELDFYNDTVWYVQIPNIKSADYVANLNAYQDALREQDVRTQTGAGNVAQAQYQSALADVARVQAEINERTLYAPFDGTITALPATLGQAAGSGETMVSLIGKDMLEIESYVPEINVTYISVGDTATITLDAYGDLEPFLAKVVAIDPAETVRDGVSTYRVVLHFITEDARVRPGMTANINITTDKRENIISIPQGAVTIKDGKRYVKVVVEKNKTEERQVMVGLVSSLGEIEILSGLAEGEIIFLK